MAKFVKTIIFLTCLLAFYRINPITFIWSKSKFIFHYMKTYHSGWVSIWIGAGIALLFIKINYEQCLNNFNTSSTHSKSIRSIVNKLDRQIIDAEQSKQEIEHVEVEEINKVYNYWSQVFYQRTKLYAMILFVTFLEYKLGSDYVSSHLLAGILVMQVAWMDEMLIMRPLSEKGYHSSIEILPLLFGEFAGALVLNNCVLFLLKTLF